MLLVALSDTHGQHRAVNVPDGDVLIVCGDVTRRGLISEVEDLGRWLGDLPHRHIVLTWGNHDRCAEANPAEAAAVLQRAAEREIHVLINRTVEIEGKNFYGTPYSNPFFDWAFMATESVQKRRLVNLKPGVDVVVSHGPAYGFCDRVAQKRCGSQALLAAVYRAEPLFVFSGHIHEGYGWETVGTASGASLRFGGCSVLDEDYRLVNAPLVAILD